MAKRNSRRTGSKPIDSDGAQRTALLIRCTVAEAEMIRERAEGERRTISGYMLKKLSTALQIEEKLFAGLSRLGRLNPITREDIPGPRTALLLRCSVEESKKIRHAAQRRGVTISGFVMHVIRRNWAATNALQYTVQGTE